jgi:hypothetical protein
MGDLVIPGAIRLAAVVIVMRRHDNLTSLRQELLTLRIAATSWVTVAWSPPRHKKRRVQRSLVASIQDPVWGPPPV